MINIIEIKAKSNDHAKIRAILLSNDAHLKGKDHQVDIYFNAPNGRLKLRKGDIENNLIYYERANNSGPKHSKVSLYKSDPSSTLKTVLENAMGTKVVVDKQREIYFIDNVKFHLDEVKDLGTFVEIEAIDENGQKSTQELLAQCQNYLKLFEIEDDDLIAVSYSDLILDLQS